MDKGTIIYIGGFELPDKNAAAHRVLSNGKILRELGYKVVFVGVDGSASSNEEPKHNIFSGFECWSVPYPKKIGAWLSYITGSSTVVNILSELKKKEHLVAVVCYNYPAIAQLRIQHAMNDASVKLISDATEWYDASAGGLLHRLVKYFDTALRMKYAHIKADGVITTSRYLTEYYSNRGKLTLELPTLYDANKFPLPTVRDNSTTRKFIYVGSPFDVGRVNKSRTNMKERLDVCVELFYNLFKAGDEFSFDIYGITKEDYLKVFPEQGDMIFQMSKCTVFHGRQPNKLVLERVQRSDFSIFFRDRTRVTLSGFPSKLAESVSCGTPVISNRMVSLIRYEGADGLFLADRGEELSLVKSLMKLSTEEINNIKKLTYSSRTFDYRSYASGMSLFLNEVKVG